MSYTKKALVWAGKITFYKQENNMLFARDGPIWITLKI